VKSQSEQNKEKNSFLLVILSQGKQVLCSVLELRLKATSQRDPYFIDEMRTCLQRMHSSNIFALIDQQMAENRPPLADPLSISVRSRASKTKSLMVLENSLIEFMSSAIEGPYNVLFNYIIHSQAQGSLIFPATLSDNLKVIEPQFIKYCEIIRQVLTVRRRHILLGDEDYLNDSESTAQMRHLSQKEEQPCIEYGIHVEDSESFAPHTIGYWIVGAMLPIDKDSDRNLTEIYICYEDSIPQNVVEVAYKLATSIL
jgi:hypothetical protein